ncbi:hypothetical protein PSECIP111951_00913 [Pseudoalteromonas holothuriae]|uniref:Uncharacterized protein n=1 Tax=Pseudoalteromonas holothuriae TaxID=2963714 RepID=A0A9W4VU92_9GAMM|nr:MULTISPECIES: hypothetical protein [unclassified Pseudoalteromonas]CAH9053881.1 hypothetical protein PSECIP111951_00913 [Pseudoalteromonas sp. CIP111951]CAH9055732.1 hypothetical protein PSECIP111854_01637 [Pseudoalteromonas sp. CIP111854]
MYAQVEKSKENKSRVVANSVAQKKSDEKQGFGFVDNRPEAVAQRTLQKMTNGYQLVKQATQLKYIDNNYTSKKQDPIQRAEKVKDNPIQLRIREGGELYDTGVNPQKKWGFTPREVSTYNVINDGAYPEITFASIDEIKVLVRAISPFLSFFTTELGQLPSPINANAVIATLVQQSETNRQGHSVARHGPQMKLPQLRDRLTTGFIGGAFAPAGAQGFATGFLSHEAFLISQKSSIEHIQTAYTATVAGLRPLITDLKNKIQQLAGLTGAAIGVKKREITNANRAIARFINDNNLNAPVGASINMLPVSINRGVYNSVGSLNHNQSNDIDGLVEFFDRYKIVLANPEQIGRGLRVNPDELANPSATVVNPAFPLNGVPEPVFESRQLQSMGEIKNSSTTVNPPNRQFVFNANIANWAAPQHFPDNGAVGWRA